MLIELQNISFCYAGTQNKSLKYVSLSVNEGECILLTGESGCGKTTLTRILNGLCPHFYDGESSGRYLLNGKNALDMELDEIGELEQIEELGELTEEPEKEGESEG